MRAALFAAMMLAAFLACARGDASGLREALLGALEAKEDLTGRRPRWCRPEKSDGNNNKCSRKTTSVAACSCKEVCEVWGDPYVAPFYSDCFVKALKTKDHWYTIWGVPAKLPDRAKFEVLAFAAGNSYHGMSDGAGEWIMEVSVTDMPVVTAKHCVDGGYKHDQVIKKFTKKLRSDVAIRENFHIEHDVEAEIVVKCRVSNGRAKIPHLAVFITVNDHGSLYLPSGELEKPGGDIFASAFSDPVMKAAPVRMADPSEEYSDFWTGSDVMMAKSTKSTLYVPPDSTYFFEEDYGVCTNPVKYGDAQPYISDRDDVDHNLRCRKSNTGFDVRECTCKSQCAMFGDPWVYDFFSPHFPNKKLAPPSLRNLKPFQIDKHDKLLYFEKVLYSFWDHVLIGIDVNSCEHVDKVRILQLKDHLMKSDECEKIDARAGKKDSDYIVEDFIAEDICETDPDKELELPPIKLGLVASGKGFDAGASFYFGDASQAKTGCGDKIVDVDSVVDLGTVQVTLKCHQTRKFKSKGNIKFFNVCVNVDDATRKYFVKKNPTFDPREIDLPKGAFNPTFFQALKNMQKSARSAGWCASGNYEDRAIPRQDLKESSNFQYRSRRDIVRFPNL